MQKKLPRLRAMGKEKKEIVGNRGGEREEWQGWGGKKTYENLYSARQRSILLQD